MSQNDDSDTEFDYGRSLLFNGIFESRLVGSSNSMTKAEAASVLSDQLPEYHSRDATSTSGFDRINVAEEMSDSDEVPDDLETITTGLISNRYTYEDRKPADAYHEGDLIDVQLPNDSTADIYWIYPDYFFFLGARDDISTAREDMFSSLTDTLRIDDIGFDSDFLLWLYYTSKDDRRIHREIEVGDLTDATVSGVRDPFGRTNSVDDSSDLTQCVPIIAGVLKKKKLTLLEGYFDLFDEYNLKAQITNRDKEQRQGRVHIKASEGDIRSRTSNIKKLAIGLNFVLELVKTYEYWDGLSPSDKYPPYDFFEDLYETAKRQGVPIEDISDDVLEEYASKRNENPDDWLP